MYTQFKAQFISVAAAIALLLPAANATADVMVYLVKLDGSEKILHEFYLTFQKHKLSDGRLNSEVCKVVSDLKQEHLGYIDFVCAPESKSTGLVGMTDVYYITTEKITLKESLTMTTQAIPDCTGKSCMRNDGGTSCTALYCNVLRKYLCYHNGQPACSNHVCQ